MTKYGEMELPTRFSFSKFGLVRAINPLALY